MKTKGIFAYLFLLIYYPILKNKQGMEGTWALPFWGQNVTLSSPASTLFGAPTS